MNGRDMRLKKRAGLIVKWLAVRFGMRYTKHINVRKRTKPERFVNLAMPIQGDHTANDFFEIGPRLVEHDLAWLERHDFFFSYRIIEYQLFLPLTRLFI